MNKQNRTSTSLLKIFANSIVIATAFSILIGSTLYFVIGAFEASPNVGLRSLAAAILPFAISFYINFFTPLFQTKRYIPPFNIYFVFSIWTLLILGLASNLYGLALPVGELLFSFTLAAVTWRYGRYAFRTFMSCCYGVVTGTLLHLVFLGLP